jgi:hypothetical protein
MRASTVGAVCDRARSFDHAHSNGLVPRRFISTIIEHGEIRLRFRYYARAETLLAQGGSREQDRNRSA